MYLIILSAFQFCLRNTIEKNINLSIINNENYSLNKKLYADNSNNKLNQDTTVKYVNDYILGPKDVIKIELLNLIDLNKTYEISTDGFIYIPRLGMVKAKGKTISELNKEITHKYGEFMLNPMVTITPISYRPVKNLLEGEVIRPKFLFS